MKSVSRVKHIIFYLVMFTLPMYMRINNLLLLLFFAFFLLEGAYLSKWNAIKKNYKLIFPLFALFILAVIASLNHPDHSVFKYLEKYWSFLAIPIVVIFSSEYQTKRGIKVFEGLMWGCVATLFICYGNVIYEMVVGKEPLHYFLRHRHLNHEFTEIADTHPAYLGVFIVTSTIYLLFESSLRKTVKITVMVFFTLGLIQLASRLAIVSFGLITMIFLLSRIRKYTKQILIGSGIALVCATLLFVSASSFLKDRLITTDSFGNDQRFSRNIVSWEIFKEYPVLGAGFGRKDALRKTKYDAYGFSIASEKKYNAHNQYLEYLSVNGIIGGITFIVLIFYLLNVSWKQRQKFFFLVLIVFFIANSTESMLVRIKGIEFFAITVSLLLANSMKLETNEHIDHT